MELVTIKTMEQFKSELSKLEALAEEQKYGNMQFS